MKPAAFEYVAPATLDEALAALAERPFEARPLAGGQSLIPAMNFRLAAPEVLVDLNGVSDLAYIESDDDGGLRIGAMTRQRALERDPRVGQLAPLLAEALPWIAHVQIRNRGTVGGSVAHADPAAELPAVFLALGARFRTAGAEGERWVPADEFFVGPFLTALEPDELLVEIALPPPRTHGDGGAGSAFIEIARRRGDYALAGVAARVEVDGAGVCRIARMGLVNAGGTPLLALRAAEALAGETPSDALLDSAARIAATEDTEPAADVHASEEYRRHLVRVLVARALRTAFARADHGEVSVRAAGR